MATGPIRKRVNTARTSQGIVTFESTVEGHDMTDEEIVAAKVSLHSALEKEYPWGGKIREVPGDGK